MPDLNRLSELSELSELEAAIVRNPLILSPDTTVATAIAQMSQMSHSSSARTVARRQKQQRLKGHAAARSSYAVVMENRQVIGILTEQDVIRLVAQGASWKCQSVRQVMSQPVLTLKESAFTSLLATVQMLEQHGVCHLPIVDEHSHLVGVVTHASLLHALNLLNLKDISDRRQARETIRQQVTQETLLREISQRIRQSLNLQTIFETACEEIRQVLQADRVGIFRFCPDSNFNDGEFVAESVVGEFPSVVAVRVHDHCFGENYSSLYAKGRFHAIDDIYGNGLKPCHSGILAQFQVRANLVMPLLCAEQL